MEFYGRIMKVLEQRKGTSERTGNEWKTQGFVFEYFEQPTDRYSDKVYLETFDENVMSQLKEGLPVLIGFGHNVEDYNGRTYNRLRMYKFEPQGQQKPAPQPADGVTGAAPAASAPTTGDAPQVNGQTTGEGGKADDLPF